MIELVVATRNEGKVREIREMMKDLPVKILSLRDFPGFPEIEEDGKTFEENALKKARALASYTNDLSIADDSGLEVDALNGAPGIYSARYFGADATDENNNKKLLAELISVPEGSRGAAFRCSIAVVKPGGIEKVVNGECRGRISFGISGSHGFGYDPLFIPEGFESTFAELGPEVKNSLSHRHKAIERLKPVLIELLAG